MQGICGPHGPCFSLAHRIPKSCRVNTDILERAISFQASYQRCRTPSPPATLIQTPVPRPAGAQCQLLQLKSTIQIVLLDNRLRVVGVPLLRHLQRYNSDTNPRLAGTGRRCGDTFLLLRGRLCQVALTDILRRASGGEDCMRLGRLPLRGGGLHGRWSFLGGRRRRQRAWPTWWRRGSA